MMATEIPLPRIKRPTEARYRQATPNQLDSSQPLKRLAVLLDGNDAVHRCHQTLANLLASKGCEASPCHEHSVRSCTSAAFRCLHATQQANDGLMSVRRSVCHENEVR